MFPPFLLYVRCKSGVTFIRRSFRDNCIIIWGNSSKYNVSKLTKLQRRACKIILENEYEGLDGARKKLIILSFDQNVSVNKQKQCTRLQMD